MFRPQASPASCPGYDVTTWYGLFAPRGTPAPVIAKLNKTMNDSLADETVRQRMAAAGVVVKTSTPQAFGDFMAAEYKRWDAVREVGGNTATIALQRRAIRGRLCLR